MIRTHFCSAAPGENYIYSSTECDLSEAKPGHFLQIQDCDVLFQIAKIAKITATGSVVGSGLEILFEDDPPNILRPGDSGKVFYDVSEVDRVLIVDPGKGFHPGQEFSLSGQSWNQAKIEIADVDNKGRIQGIEILSRGEKTKAETETITLPAVNGLDAKIEIIYRLKETKAIEVSFPIDQMIDRFGTRGSQRIEKGLLSIEKYKITLNALFPKTLSKAPKRYQIVSEFTPHLQLPLLASNSFYSETIINRNFLALDARIAKLEEEISKGKASPLDAFAAESQPKQQP